MTRTQFEIVSERGEPADPRRDVVVVGASPDRINRNTIMRKFVAEGLSQVLGSDQVAECSFENSLTVVAAARPRLLVCFGSCMPDVCDYGPLRDLCDRLGTRIAFWLHDDPYEFDFSYRAVQVADWVFSNDSWAAAHYEHSRTFFLPMAASKAAHFRDWTPVKDREVFFCGVGFPNRVQLFRDLSPVLQGLRCSVLGDNWPQDLAFARNERLDNTQWADACSRSLVTVNVGRSLHLANRRFQLDPSTPGPRTFEAAMAGTVQLYFTDGLEVTDFFEPGREILLFDSPADFRRQIEQLLDSPELTEQIARSAQSRALRDHTYASRAGQLLSCCGWSVVKPSAQAA